MRLHAVSVPSFQVASDKYYRSMLEPAYDGIRSSLQSRLDKDSPPIYSVGLDLWSSHHSGYMGINLHYLDKDWERVIFNLACTPFDESHTGLNIATTLHTILDDWKIKSKMAVCLRDNAKNMISAFNEENQEAYQIKLVSAGCMNHTLQLAIKDEIFLQPSVETILLKCRSVVSYANSSNKFYPEFYKNQVEKMNETDRKCLKSDNATRWVMKYDTYCLGPRPLSPEIAAKVPVHTAMPE